MKTKKSEITKRSIVDAAEILFQKKSVDKVTVAEICKEAGIAKGTFYLYFETKDDMVWSFIEVKLGEMVTWFQNFENIGYTSKDINRIVEFIKAFANEQMKLLELIHHVRFYSYLGIDQMTRKYHEVWFRPVYKWVEKGKALGLLDIGDAKHFAAIITLGTHEVMDCLITGIADFDINAMCEELRRILERFIVQ